MIMSQVLFKNPLVLLIGTFQLHDEIKSIYTSQYIIEALFIYSFMF